MIAVICFVVGLTAVTAFPTDPQRIVGGSLTTIDYYPYAASLLYSPNLVTYNQACGGSILTTRSILTAAHCLYGDAANRWRSRVGSTWANSGGVLHNTGSIITHVAFNNRTFDNDIAILHTATMIVYSNYVRAASIPSATYVLADNQTVYAIGWGRTAYNGSASEQLRHVQIWTVNQATCRTRYADLGYTVTDNMLCSGWLDVGGRDQCQYDSGSPLIHNLAVVGICSWGQQCGLARYPGVNTRVSRYNSWILANA